MPKQVGKSSLASALGDRARGAFEEHKADPTEYGNIELPGGIENGIAQLSDFKFTQVKEGSQNAGEWMMYAAGIVVSPNEVDGTPIKGLRTQISEPLFDTPTRTRKTVEDHLAWILNEMRKLGVDTAELGFDDLEDIAESLRESKPYFRFRTWKPPMTVIEKRADGKWYVGGKKYATEAMAKQANPYAGTESRVNHMWAGVVQYEPDESEGVEDDTEESPAPAPVTNKTVAAAPAKKTVAPKPAPAATATVKKGTTVKKSAPAPEPAEDDLDALATLADDGDTNAQAKLAGQAKLFGIDSDEMESWADVVEAIKAQSDADSAEAGDETEQDETATVDYDALATLADGGDEEAVAQLIEAAEAASIDHNEYATWVEMVGALIGGEEAEPEAEEAEAYKPTKGDVVMFTPKGKRKPIECEVTAVFDGKETCNLKSLDDQTVFKSVPWSSIEG